jgi:tripartite-type tricarboxylate transporter receptor subunit TctC
LCLRQASNQKSIDLELRLSVFAEGYLSVWSNMMKLPRRNFLRLVAGAAAPPTLPGVAWALDYPTRPVRIIVGVAAGGGNDIRARLIAQYLSVQLGQQFLVVNQAGGSGIVAREEVARALDGHTLLYASSTDATEATLLVDKSNFVFLRDIAPVGGIARSPFVMVVNASFPTKTLPEFIAYAKDHPGKINMGSAGTGGINHLFGELFKAMTGVNLVHVPYRGGAQALTDLIAGQIQVLWVSVPPSLPYIQAGTLRALGITTAVRVNALPDIPTIGEFVPGYEASQFNGLGAPRNTPVEIIDKLNSALNSALADPKLRARLVDLGDTPLPGSPADFQKLIGDETEKWAKVIKSANIKAE